VFIVVSVYFVIDSVRKRLGTPRISMRRAVQECNEPSLRLVFLSHMLLY